MPRGLQSLTSVEEAAVGELHAVASARAASGGIHGKPPSLPRGGRVFDRIRNLFNRSGSNSSVSGQSAALSQNSIIKQQGMASEEEVLSIRNRSRYLYSTDHDLDIMMRNTSHPHNVLILKGSAYSSRVLRDKSLYSDREITLANMMKYHIRETQRKLPDLTSSFADHRGYLKDIIENGGNMSTVEYNKHSESIAEIESVFLERLTNSKQDFVLLKELLDLRDTYISSSTLEYFSNRLKVSI